MAELKLRWRTDTNKRQRTKEQASARIREGEQTHKKNTRSNILLVCSNTIRLSITYVYGRCRSQFSFSFLCYLHNAQGYLLSHSKECSEHFNRIIQRIQKTYKYIVSYTHEPYTHTRTNTRTPAHQWSMLWFTVTINSPSREKKNKREFAAMCQRYRSTEINWQHCFSASYCELRVDLHSYSE